MPLSFLAKDAGFEMGLPTVESTATVITGPHTPGISATLSSATSFSLTRYDKISASLTYRNANTSLGTLTLAEGSPFVFYRAKTDSTFVISGVGTVVDASSAYLRYTKAGHAYAIAGYDKTTISREGSTATVRVPANGLATFYALPDASTDPLHDLAGNELANVSTVSSTENTHSLTTFTYHTANNRPTVFVQMSYSDAPSSQTTSLVQYDSIYGPMQATSGNEFTLSAPLVSASNSLDLTHLSDDEKKQIIASLQKDITSTSITAQDSYFAGKGLARAANLLQLAESLGEADKSAQLIAMLKSAFASRLAPTYFYYDTALHGMAATTAAFGSEDFNDHHFHYGYFLYAASILASYDTSFLTEYRDRINLLAADIASYTGSKDFPLQRNYDAYAQHGWAAGLAPFADGNNQESSSEAINAWNGAALWGKVTKNDALEQSATWMLSNESATAQRAWRIPSTTLQASYLKAYTSPVSSLNFGGKRTYGTFFSDEASAKLGIQLIPMVPSMQQFAKDGNEITSTVNHTIAHDNFNVPLGDYILMYQALSDPTKAKNLLTKQTTIDDGNSKSYLEAWIFSRTN